MRKMDVQQRVDLAVETGKALPPIAVVGADIIMGHGISYWVGIATLAYIGLQAAYLLYKWWRLAHERRMRDDDAD